MPNYRLDVRLAVSTSIVVEAKNEDAAQEKIDDYDMDSFYRGDLGRRAGRPEIDVENVELTDEPVSVSPYYKAPPLAAPADTEDTIYMHNVIMGPIPDGYIVAHIDGNGLNNRRDNLCLIPIWNGPFEAMPGDGPYAARPRHIEGWHFEHEC